MYENNHFYHRGTSYRNSAGDVCMIINRVIAVGVVAGLIIALIVLAAGFFLSIKYSPAVNGTMPVVYSNGTLVNDQCQKYS